MRSGRNQYNRNGVMAGQSSGEMRRQGREENREEKQLQTGEGNRQQSGRRNRRQTGTDYERAAGGYLESIGYEILEYNYRCKTGEIDIVAKDGEYIVFCEVKYRSDRRKGGALAAVDARKQQIIFRCAMFYLTERHLGDVPCRWDKI